MVGERKCVYRAYRVLVGKLEYKRQRARPRPRWKGNIKNYLQVIGWGTWAGLIWLRIRISSELL